MNISNLKYSSANTLGFSSRCKACNEILDFEELFCDGEFCRKCHKTIQES